MELTGEICCAHCTCMAGLGEACTHVAAILFYLETRVRIDGQPTCTQQSCQWVMPAFQKDIPYLQIRDVDFTSPNSMKSQIDQSIIVNCPSSSSTTSFRQPNAKPPNPEELSGFFTTLSTCKTKPAILSIIPNFSTQYVPAIRNGTLPLPLQSLYNPKHLALNYLELLQVCDSTEIQVSQDMAKAVEKATIEQASSKLWYKFRAGRITASRMKQACHTDHTMPSQSLVKAICYPEAFKFLSKATRWGCQHEATALEKYNSLLSNSHQNFITKPSGLVLKPRLATPWRFT